MKQQYSVNLDFFKNWTKESAYVFGFISADGSVTHYYNKKQQKYIPCGLSIKIHNQDTKVLENFKCMMHYSGPLRYNVGENKNQTELSISKKSVAEDLINLGLMRNKSYELKWPTNIPEEFMPFYLAGLFDGDGSVYPKPCGNPNFVEIGVNLTGTLDVCEGLKQYFSTIYGKEIGHIEKFDTYAAYFLNGVTSALCFLDHIYINSTSQIRMERKYDKYLQFKNIDYPKYLEYLELSINNLTPVDYKIAEEIRKAREHEGLTYNQLSKRFNVHGEVIRAILDGITHTKSDNRDGHATCYITAFNETRHILDWIEDDRCIVGECTLYHRLFKSERNWASEEALTTEPDYTSGTLKHVVEAFGESKTLSEWNNDERCKVTRSTIMRRINVLGMTPEEAITATEVPYTPPVYKDGKVAGNQKTTQATIEVIRELSNTTSIKEIATQLNIPYDRTRAIANNKTFNNGEEIKSHKIHQHLIDINGALLTIRQLSDNYNIPYETIDRWHRDNLNISDMIKERMSGKTRVFLGKTKSQKDIDSWVKANKVRQDYKDGIIGKKNYENNNITKNCYVDIVGNRQNKEEIIWWKE